MANKAFFTIFLVNNCSNASLAQHLMPRILATPRVAPLLAIIKVPLSRVRLYLDPFSVRNPTVSETCICVSGIFVSDATVSHGMKFPLKYLGSPAGLGEPPRTTKPISPSFLTSQSFRMAPTSVCLQPGFTSMRTPSFLGDGSHSPLARPRGRPSAAAGFHSVPLVL